MLPSAPIDTTDIDRADPVPSQLVAEVSRTVQRVMAWAADAGCGPLDALAAFGGCLAHTVGLRPDGFFAARATPPGIDDLAAAVPLPASEVSAYALAKLREVALDAAARASRGAHYTPLDVAQRLSARALTFVADPLAADPSICDPSVGSGVFLLAMAAELERRGFDRRDAATRLFGCDIDPVAVDVARLALQVWSGGPVSGIDRQVVVGDALRADADLWPGPPGLHGGFTAVVGNPPFLSQLRDRSVRARADARELVARFGAAAAGYVDTSALFLVRGCELAAPAGGVVLLIQPQSILAAQHAEAARGIVGKSAALAGLWVARDRIFEAGVRVCAPILVRSGAVAPLRRFVDRDVREVDERHESDSADTNWGRLVADVFGVPPVPEPVGQGRLDTAGWSAAAGFRDQFYGLVPAVRERSAPSSAPGLRLRRLATCGSIDPLCLTWGEQPIRFARRVWAEPVVDLDAVAPAVRAWFAARDRPKLLVATQTRVVECAVDVDGSFVAVTPVLTLVPPADRLWHAAAALTNPIACAAAIGAAAGTALSVGAIKLSARQLLGLPRPCEGRAWDCGAALARDLANDPLARADASAWSELGRVMCDAFGVDPAGAPAAALVDWWLDRLGVEPAAAAAVP